MPRANLVTKLWIAFTALIMVVMIPLELALGRLLTDFYHQQVMEPMLYHSQQLATLLARDRSALSMAPMMGHMVGGEVLVLDATGAPVAFEGTSTLTPPAAAVQTARTGEAAATYFDVGHTHYIVTAVPISSRSGAVVLIAPAAPLQQSLSLARRYLWLGGGVTLALGALLALALSRSLMRPVLAIERATVEIARGDFSTRVPVESEDELGKLARAVNHMTVQLDSYERRRREFLANVAHELRTPLSYIRGYAQAVTEGLVTSPDDQDRYLHIVQEESVRLGRLVDDLMDMAQMDEGQLSLDMHPLDLRLPVEQAVATVQPLADQKGVHLIVRLQNDLPKPVADGVRIQQVVVNLLDNGLRHTPAGGSLTLAVRRVERQVEVRITDTGEGIPAEGLPLVFERFHKRNSKGRGLGLAIVRSIIRAHGGEVGVDSEPGKGSTFWFHLPVA
jgi:signal transduction histidine kinase